MPDRITIRMPKELGRKLKQRASAAKKTESQLIRDAIQTYLAASEPQQSAYDLAKSIGLIGALRNGPKDLSTDPKHMAGFGKK